MIVDSPHTLEDFGLCHNSWWQNPGSDIPHPNPHPPPPWWYRCLRVRYEWRCCEDPGGDDAWLW